MKVFFELSIKKAKLKVMKLKRNHIYISIFSEGRWLCPKGSKQLWVTILESIVVTLALHLFL